MSIVMGLDQHRAQITAEWIDTATGEVSRGRVAPADRAGVRRFLARFGGQQLEVACHVGPDCGDFMRLTLLVCVLCALLGVLPSSASATHGYDLD